MMFKTFNEPFKHRAMGIFNCGLLFSFYGDHLGRHLDFSKSLNEAKWHHAFSELTWSSELETTKFHVALSSMLC